MGGDNLTVPADGKFVFAIPINNGNLYNVTVLTQPSGEVCSVSSGSGIISGNTVANVAIFCSTNKYTVGGTVTGLTGSVTLQNNSGDTLPLNSNGTYTFTTQVAFGSPYTVTVSSQPGGNQTCSVANGASTMGATNVTNVNISCATSTYVVGGTVSGFNTNSGIVGNKLVLQNNGGNDLNITTNGTFNFSTAITYNNPYNVTVKQQPSLQACTIAAAGANGIITSTVSDIAVSCGTLNGGGVQGNALNLATAQVSTLAGAATGSDGTGAGARFSNPTDSVTDGINLYVVDTYNNKIRKVVIATGVVTTFAGSPNNSWGAADGVGTAATFYYPRGITTDGTSLYVVDTYNYKIRKIDIATATVTSITGPTNNTAALSGAIDGAGASATFSSPMGITYLAGFLYVADYGNCKIRKLDVNGATVSSLTGATGLAPYAVGGTVCGAVDATGVTASFSYPQALTNDGTNLYVADTSNLKIRKIGPAVASTLATTTNANVVVSSVTGLASTTGTMGATDGSAATATFYYPQGITTDGVNLYVADTYNNKIRKIVIAGGAVSSMTGMMNLPASWGASNGIGPAARFGYPQGVTTDGINLYVMDSSNNTIRAVSIAPVTVSTLAGGIAGADGIGAAASMNYPRGITSDGSNLYVADTNSNKIRKIVISTGAVTTFAGTGASGAIDGHGSVATFSNPQGITTDGASLYVADSGNNKIRKINITTGVVSSLTGLANTTVLMNYTCLNVSPWTCTPPNPVDGAGATATFWNPQGITTDGTNLYVADTGSNKIRKVVIATGFVSSLTGPANTGVVMNSTCLNVAPWTCTPPNPVDGAGATATFWNPQGITTDGTNLYVADTSSNKIRKVVIATGFVSSVTGAADTGVVMNSTCLNVAPWTCTPPIPVDGAGTTATFLNPQGITTDGTNLYVTDSGSNKIRQIVISTNVVSSVTGAANTFSTAGFTDGPAASASFNYPAGITTDGGALYVIDLYTYTIRKIQ
jgi:sugar lactone lactonase YvrE